MPVQDHIDNLPRYAEFNPGVTTTTFPLPFPLYQADDSNELKSDFLITRNGTVQTGYTVSGTFVDGVSIDAAIVFNPGITGNLKVWSRRRPRTSVDIQNGRGITPEELRGTLNGMIASLRDVYDWMTALEAGNALPPGTFVPTSGGIMAGFLTLVADPTQALHAATKQYVDARLPVIAKGDLITHTGTVPARLPVGNAGRQLVTDPVQSGGLRWRRNGGTIQTLISGSNIAWDMSLADSAQIIMAHSGAFQTPTSMEVGQAGHLYVEQDATGNRVPTWDGVFKWPNSAVQRPDLAAGAVTRYSWRVKSLTPAVTIEIAKDWMSGRDGFGFFREFDLGTYQLNSLYSTSHGLGTQPSLMVAALQCITIDNEYAVGDRIWNSSSSDGAGFAVWSNATNAGVTLNRTVICTKNTYVATFPTAGRWKVILRVYE